MGQIDKATWRTRPSPKFLLDPDEQPDQPGYLDSADEGMPSYLDENASGMVAPPANAPMAAPPIAPQQTPAGLPPLDPSKAIAARQAVSQQLNTQPMAAKPKWWQSALAGLAGGAAGYVNAGGRVSVDPKQAQQSILFPGLQRKQANWQKELEAKQAQAELEGQNLKDVAAARKEQTEEEYKKAQTRQAKVAADTLEAEGKRAPKANYITVPGGGLYDAEAGKWVKQPLDKTQVIEVDPMWAKEHAPYLKPDADGVYTIPAAAMGQLISSQKTPADKALKFEHFTDENNGDVTTIGYDPLTGVEKTRSIVKGVAKKKTQPGISLTPEAVQFWGQAAAQGVPLPSMGMGASGAQARQQIINAAPGAAGGNPLVANRAQTQANAGSLTAMQKMRDAVVSFENTAKANLDIFSNAAKKVVDSGSPLVNQPLRAINRDALGSSEVAAFDAARQVALTEISKVVNNPNLAGQLSDSARHEVTSLIPENATLGQIYHVVQVLKQDMANRHKFLDQQLGEIKGRMGGAQGVAPAAHPDPLGVR